MQMEIINSKQISNSEPFINFLIIKNKRMALSKMAFHIWKNQFKKYLCCRKKVDQEIVTQNVRGLDPRWFGVIVVKPFTRFNAIKRPVCINFYDIKDYVVMGTSLCGLVFERLRGVSWFYLWTAWFWKKNYGTIRIFLNWKKFTVCEIQDLFSYQNLLVLGRGCNKNPCFAIL